jgi:nucleotide-binding universal stress UspA family protein
MSRRIVVPLDGSELAERALQYAKTPAARIGAEIVLLHVCGPEECQREAEKCTVQPMHRAYVEHTAKVLSDELEAATGRSVEIGQEVLVGDPATEIVNGVSKQDADRIIMASHGRSGVSRWILGSVAEKVARESPVPVIIIRASAEEAERSDSPERKILVLLDGSGLAEEVLPYVKEHAEMSGREVTLLHVCEPPEVEPSFVYYASQWGYPPTKPLKWEDYVEEEMTKVKKGAKEYLEKIGKRFSDAGIKVSSEVLLGKPAREIVDYVARNPFNLVAMSTHGRSGVSRWAYGSVADRVLHAVSSPLLLVRGAA